MNYGGDSIFFSCLLSVPPWKYIPDPQGLVRNLAGPHIFLLLCFSTIYQNILLTGSNFVHLPGRLYGARWFLMRSPGCPQITASAWRRTLMTRSPGIILTNIQILKTTSEMTLKFRYGSFYIWFSLEKCNYVCAIPFGIPVEAGNHSSRHCYYRDLY